MLLQVDTCINLEAYVASLSLGGRTGAREGYDEMGFTPQFFFKANNCLPLICMCLIFFRSLKLKRERKDLRYTFQIESFGNLREW